MPNDTMPEPTPAKPAQPPPSLYLNEKDLDKFGLHDCMPGESYTAKVRFTVTGMDSPSSGETSKRIEIDDMSDVASEGAPGEPAAEPEAENSADEASADETPTGDNEEETAGVPYIRRKAKKPVQFPVDFKKLQKL